MTSQTYTDSSYVPATLAVRFSHADLDWIKVALQATGGGTKVTVYDDSDAVIESSFEEDAPSEASFLFSSVFCPFNDFIAWLEAGTTLVESCAFTWEAEGPDGRLEFNRSDLRLTWPSPHDPEGGFAFDCMVDRLQAVEAFYTAFRRFVNSDEYDPSRYEADASPSGWENVDIAALFSGANDAEGSQPSAERIHPAWGVNLRQLRSTMVEAAIGWVEA